MKDDVKGSSSYWSFLPIPREWKLGENADELDGTLNDQLLNSMMDEWLSTHPMDGG